MHTDTIKYQHPDTRVFHTIKECNGHTYCLSRKGDIWTGSKYPSLSLLEATPSLAHLIHFLHLDTQFDYSHRSDLGGVCVGSVWCVWCVCGWGVGVSIMRCQCYGNTRCVHVYGTQTTHMPLYNNKGFKNKNP